MPLCIIKHCKNRTQSRPVLGQIKKKEANVSYHRFPKNEKLKSLWLNVLKLNAESVPVGARVCSAHFSKDAYYFLNGIKRLRPDVLPNIGHVIEDIPKDEMKASITDISKDEMKASITDISKDEMKASIVDIPKDEMKASIEDITKDEMKASIEDIPKDEIKESISMCTDSKVDRATSPIPECSRIVDQSTSMLIKREPNSLELEYLRQKLQDTRTFYLKKIKILQQKVRRKKSRITYLEATLDSLRKSNEPGTI